MSFLWKVDMISFEQECRNFFTDYGIGYKDGTGGSGTDFFLEPVSFHLEVKEKRQYIKTSVWPTTIPQDHLFILDELTVRKLFFAGSRSGLAIRTSIQNEARYYFVDTLNLMLMPRTRANRWMTDQHPKGKWLIDLRNTYECQDVEDIYRLINKYLQKIPDMQTRSECWGEYVGEIVEKGGEERTWKQYTHDYKWTR